MVRDEIMPAVRQIIEGYLAGTQYDIGVDGETDGNGSAVRLRA